MNEIRRLAAAAVACAVLLSPLVSAAESERTTYHTLERIWPTAIRFLRVDMRYDIVDRDPDTAYVLFEFDDDDRRFRGSLELIRTADSQGRDQLRLVLNLHDRPTWMEDMVMGKLDQKIYDEHGSARPPKPRPKQPDEPEDGKDGKDGDDGKGGKGGKDETKARLTR